MHAYAFSSRVYMPCLYVHIWVVCICRNNIYDRCLWKYIYPSIEQLQFSSEYFYSHWIGWMVNCKVERRLRKVKFVKRLSFEQSPFESKLELQHHFWTKRTSLNLTEPIGTYPILSEQFQTYPNLSQPIMKACRNDLLTLL